MYDLMLLTSMDSWTKPRRLELRTIFRDSVISVTLSVVSACTRRDIGQAFSRPTGDESVLVTNLGSQSFGGSGALLTVRSTDAVKVRPSEVVWVSIRVEDHLAGVLVDLIGLIDEA